MPIKSVRIATRNSPLALWQAEFVGKALCNIYPDLNIELIGIKTSGDIILDTPLATVGGKGLFIKELEQKLLDRSADIAVHSIKDVTIDLPEELELPVIMKRDDARDVFISNHYRELSGLPEGACIGTSSLRRQSQLLAYRPDLQVKTLRGNVGTRLRKLDEEQFDAIVLAAAGMARLLYTDRITEFIPTNIMLPAVGQGAIGIETRRDDQEIKTLLEPLHDSRTCTEIIAERAFSRRLYGGCQLPIAAKAEFTSGKFTITGMVGSVDGKRIVRDCISGNTADSERLAIHLAENLLDNGAEEILQELINA